jgi:hypothetical protein
MHVARSMQIGTDCSDWLRFEDRYGDCVQMLTILRASFAQNQRHNPFATPATTFRRYFAEYPTYRRSTELRKNTRTDAELEGNSPLIGGSGINWNCECVQDLDFFWLRGSSPAVSLLLYDSVAQRTDSRDLRLDHVSIFQKSLTSECGNPLRSAG